MHNDILNYILQSFLEKRLFSIYRLVCKQWNDILVINSIKNREIVECCNNKYLSLLKWLILEQGLNPSRGDICCVTEYGELQIMYCLKNNDFYDTINTSHCNTRKKRQTKKIIEESYVLNYKPDEKLYKTASAYGHLEILKWLKNQYPSIVFTERCTYFAANSGQLEVLKWLIDNNCPINTLLCWDIAGKHNKKHIEEYLFSLLYVPIDKYIPDGPKHFSWQDFN